MYYNSLNSDYLKGISFKTNFISFLVYKKVKQRINSVTKLLIFTLIVDISSFVTRQ